MTGAPPAPATIDAPADPDGWQRLVAVERVLNCRDMGGYPAGDGLRVRRGMIFRSGDLGALSEGDVERMMALGLSLVFDMRSNKERLSRPSVAALAGRLDILHRDYDHSRANLVAQAKEGAGADAERVAALMGETYRRLPYEQAESIGGIFRAIADGRVPILIHCAAGKDRTGVASALLLDLLGVEREAIFEDFLLTNRFFDRIMRRFLVKSGLAESDRETWTPLIRAERAYLEGMFAMIEARHGSSRAYLAETAGVDAAMAERIRARLLERV